VDEGGRGLTHRISRRKLLGSLRRENRIWKGPRGYLASAMRIGGLEREVGDRQLRSRLLDTYLVLRFQYSLGVR